MPKYAKKPKGTDAHQHVAGEDWTKVEPWLQDLITQGRIDTDPPQLVSITGTWPINPTDWITLDPEGLLLIMTDAHFSNVYDKVNI